MKLDITRHKASSLQKMMTLNALQHMPQQQEELLGASNCKEGLSQHAHHHHTIQDS